MNEADYYMMELMNLLDIDSVDTRLILTLRAHYNKFGMFPKNINFTLNIIE